MTKDDTADVDRSDDTADQGRLWPWLVGGLIVLAIGAGGYWYLTRADQTQEMAPPQPPLIETGLVAEAAQVVIRQTGFVRPVSDVTVVSEITARIASVSDSFTRGATVARGDVLVQLDTTRLQAERQRAAAGIAQAEAVVAEAQISVDRQRQLEENNIASEATLQQALVELATADAALQTARAERDLIQQRIDDAIIRAPFDAVVAQATADPGALATAGMSLGELIASAQAEVEMGLTPGDLALLGDAQSAMGAPVRVLAVPSAADGAATGPRIAQGTVTALGPQIDAQTRTVALIVRIDDPFAATREGFPDARPIRIGELLTLELSVDLSERGAVSVPGRAVKSGDVVWRVADGILSRSEVDVLRRGTGEGARVVLGAGAPAPGTRVMLTDLAAATDGQDVRVDAAEEQ
ncbi:efflux RND transporter periplasmic adaptor subunit [uncultured Sulfitobacter sp.]|uniref:efflux RND transporter periplasmic adaptor subunit n=1 Tax=uncultured Sulfitobacter sp. TaxID=191468 RepID=UPI002625ABEB|nr:efflux RND transporter periplasmic adaptor subunit [uncultured Sulfitobacter sp.]